MTHEALKQAIDSVQSGLVYDEQGEWLKAEVTTSDWKSFARKLNQTDALLFDFLFCLTCVDWKTHLEMVYHLRSTKLQHHLVVKCKLDRIQPQIDTVSDIWRTAEFHEREVFELFGVDFINHPDLRLLILPEGWEGKFPLRKDFEDPVNMIKL